MIPEEAFERALENASRFWQREYETGYSDYKLGRLHAYREIRDVAERLANHSPTNRLREVAQYQGSVVCLHKAVRSIRHYLETGDRKKALDLLAKMDEILLNGKSRKIRKSLKACLK